MINLGLDKIKTVLCLGAHADDIEIGGGGTVLRLVQENPDLKVHWVVLSSDGPRRAEAEESAARFLQGARETVVDVQSYRDRYFPAQWEEIKDTFNALGRSVSPDLILTHRGDDAHQDHRVISELTWHTFRDHWILEYEIPKYEGDLGHPNVFVPLTAQTARDKAENVFDGFASQQDKPWFATDTFLALARIRGLECNAPEHFAEGFYSRKLTL